jgi:hypothetical protein
MCETPPIAGLIRSTRCTRVQAQATAFADRVPKLRQLTRPTIDTASGLAPVSVAAGRIHGKPLESNRVKDVRATGQEQGMMTVLRVDRLTNQRAKLISPLGTLLN